MIRIGVRELRQHASRFLARVKSGETVEITERGVAIALLVPAEPRSTARQKLIDEGLLRPAVAPWRPPRRRQVHQPSADVLGELRDDRL